MILPIMHTLFALTLIGFTSSKHTFGRAEENVSTFDYEGEEDHHYQSSDLDPEEDSLPDANFFSDDELSSPGTDEEYLLNEFFSACVRGSVTEIAVWIDSRPELVDALDEMGQSCMMMASVLYYEAEDENHDRESYVHVDPVDVIKTIVDAGGDVNLRADDNQFRMPALAFHVAKYNHETVEYLLEKGADVNAEFDAFTEDGEVRRIITSLDLYETLYERDETKNMFSDDDRTLILKTGETLRRHGATRFSEKGDVLESVVTGMRRGENASFSNSLPNEEFLPLEFWEDQVDDLMHAFFEACVGGELERIDEAIDIMPELVDTLDQTGLSCAMMAGLSIYEEEEMGNDIHKHAEPFDVVKLIVESGGDVNLRADPSNLRMPVIAFHVVDNNYRIIEYLLEKGADVNAKFDGYADDGRVEGTFTPLDLYMYFEKDSPGMNDGYEDFMDAMAKTKEVLLRHGAKRMIACHDEL